MHPDPTRAAAPSLMAQLRAATRAEHESIERAVPLASASLTLATYERYLGRALGFYRPLEPLLEARLAGRDALELPLRRKRALLEADLLQLGVSPARLAALPDCPPAPLPGAAAAAGCLYVLEGSTLGGQILLRHVAAHLQLGPGRGASFLAAYGPRTGEMWRRLRHVLDGDGALDAAADQVIAGARGTFTALEAWLAGALATH